MLMNRKKAEEEFDRVFGFKHQSEKSVRTEYRRKRRALIEDLIMKLIKLHSLSDNKLERIPLDILIDIKKNIGECSLEANPYQRDITQ